MRVLIILVLLISCKKNHELVRKEIVFHQKQQNIKNTWTIRPHGGMNEVYKLKFDERAGQLWAFYCGQELNETLIKCYIENRTTGKKLANKNPQEEWIDFILHPSGEITLLALTPKIDSEYSKMASILRYDKNGRLRKKVQLDENHQYFIGYNLAIEEMGEDIVLMSSNVFTLNNYSFLSYDKNLQLKWTQEFPTNQKHLYVASKMSKWNDMLYGILSNEDSHFLVHLKMDGIIMKEQKLEFLEGSIHVNIKVDKDNIYFSYTKKNKIFLTCLNNDGKFKEIKWQEHYSFSPKEYIKDFIIVGDFLVLGGETNYTQAKTGSVLTYGKKLLFFVDKNSGILRKGIQNPMIFGTQRRDIINSLVKYSDTGFYFAGVENGPITHDASWYSGGFISEMEFPYLSYNIKSFFMN